MRSRNSPGRMSTYFLALGFVCFFVTLVFMAMGMTTSPWTLSQQGQSVIKTGVATSFLSGSVLILIAILVGMREVRHRKES